MKVIYLSSGNDLGMRCFQLLLENREIEVVACDFRPKGMYEAQIDELCKKNCICQIEGEEIAEVAKDEKVDLGISVFYSVRLLEQQYTAPKWGIINFHSAPLPGYRGINGMCAGILDKIDYWEATAHFIDSERYNVGRLIDKRRIPVNPEMDTVHDIAERMFPKQIELFQAVMERFLQNGDTIMGQQLNEESGRYFGRKDWLEARIITGPEDASLEEKVRAFWWPKSGGCALMQINGKRYGLINETMMEEIKLLYQKGRECDESSQRKSEL